MLSHVCKAGRISGQMPAAASVHRIDTKLGTLVEQRSMAQLCNCSIVPLKCVVFPHGLDNTPKWFWIEGVRK